MLPRSKQQQPLTGSASGGRGDGSDRCSRAKLQHDLAPKQHGPGPARASFLFLCVFLHANKSDQTHWLATSQSIPATRETVLHPTAHSLPPYPSFAFIPPLPPFAASLFNVNHQAVQTTSTPSAAVLLSTGSRSSCATLRLLPKYQSLDRFTKRPLPSRSNIPPPFFTACDQPSWSPSNAR